MATMTIIRKDGKIGIINFEVNKPGRWIPAIAFVNLKLAYFDGILLGLIDGLCQNTGICVASNAYLARKLKVTNKTIEGSLSHLDKQKYIIRKVIKKGKRIVGRKITIHPACIEKYKRLVFEENKDEFTR